MKLELDLDGDESPAAEVGPEVRAEIRYAGFWIRFVAFVIDSVVFGVGLALPFYFLFDNTVEPLSYSAPLEQQLAQLSVMGQQFVAKSGIYFAIYAVCWMRFLGTPGKLLLSTQIVDAKTLAPLSLGQSVLRYLGYFVSTLTLFIGFIWVGIDAKKRGLHDLMAGSVVIYKPVTDRKK